VDGRFLDTPPRRHSDPLFAGVLAIIPSISLALVSDIRTPWLVAFGDSVSLDPWDTRTHSPSHPHSTCARLIPITYWLRSISRRLADDDDRVAPAQRPNRREHLRFVFVEHLHDVSISRGVDHAEHVFPRLKRATARQFDCAVESEVGLVVSRALALLRLSGQSAQQHRTANVQHLFSATSRGLPSPLK